MRTVFFKRVARDQRGVTAIEFALLAPVFLMMLLGAFDLAYNSYMASVLDGSIQKAARNSSLEHAAATKDAVDAAVRSAVLCTASPRKRK